MKLLSASFLCIYSMILTVLVVWVLNTPTHGDSSFCPSNFLCFGLYFLFLFFGLYLLYSIVAEKVVKISTNQQTEKSVYDKKYCHMINLDTCAWLTVGVFYNHIFYYFFWFVYCFSLLFIFGWNICCLVCIIVCVYLFDCVYLSSAPVASKEFII